MDNEKYFPYPGGVIIDFEGLDCSFKETNAKALVERMNKRFNYNPVVFQSFPRYGNEICKPIEKWLQGKYDRGVLMNHPQAIDTLYSIDRFDYWYSYIDNYSVINMASFKNTMRSFLFIFDRYTISNAIYNPMYGDMPTIDDFTFDNKVFAIPNPDIVIWMRMKNFEAFKIILQNKKDKDRNESDIEFIKKVWDRSEYAIENKLFEKAGIHLIVIDCLDECTPEDYNETLVRTSEEYVSNQVRKLGYRIKGKDELENEIWNKVTNYFIENYKNLEGK